MPEMTDDTRKALEAYCPEIEQIYALDFCTTEEQFLALIASTLRSEIIRRGEWRAFEDFAFRKYFSTQKRGATHFFQEAFTQWLTSAPTFLKVAGEWVGRKATDELRDGLTADGHPINGYR